MNIAAGTIISKNYLAFARVLADSLRLSSPGIPLFVLLADKVDGFFESEQEGFELIPLARLSIPNIRSFCFRYNRRELLSALKPYLLTYLLDRGFNSALYLDADTLVLNDLSPLIERVVSHAFTVTPHIVEPLRTGDAVERELSLLKSGTYNAGIVGVSDRAASRHFLSWWQARVADHCVHAVNEGIYLDQKWLDYAPSFIEDTAIFRDPAYNVAYWNLSQRQLRLDGETVRVGGVPCGLFHFSGFDPRIPDRITSYWGQVDDTVGETAAGLFHRYAEMLRAAGSDMSLTWPYAYDCFDNGVAIPDLARQEYRALPNADGTFGDPFHTFANSSYYRWLNSPIDDFPGGVHPITQLWRIVYDRRPDVQLAFPEWLAGDRQAFLTWTETTGANEHGIATALLPARRASKLRFTGTCDEAEFRRRCAEQDSWYHSFYFDNGFEQRGDYNIGLNIDEYGFPSDLSGMSVLDVGTGSGWFAAYFEQLGAEVTTVDVRGYCDFDLPGRMVYPDIRTEKPVPDRIGAHGEELYFSPVSKGFWIMKEILGLKAEYLNARVYDVHTALKGRKFDLVFAGAVLMHLRDPIGGLLSLRAVCRNRIIANSLVSDRDTDVPLMESLEGQRNSWWKPNRRCLTSWFRAAGFSSVDVTRYVRLSADGVSFDGKHSIAADQTLALVHASVDWTGRQ